MLWKETAFARWRALTAAGTGRLLPWCLRWRLSFVGPLQGRNVVPRIVDLGGSKLACPTFWIVDQSSPDLFHPRGRNRSRSHVFPILDILTHSGDIRDQNRKLCKITPNVALVSLGVYMSVSVRYSFVMPGRR